MNILAQRISNYFTSLFKRKQIKIKNVNTAVDADIYDDYNLDYNKIVAFLNTSYTLRAVHNIIRSSSHALDIVVFLDDKESYLFSDNLDSKFGNAIADYVILGAVKMLDNFSYVHYNDEVFSFVVYNDNCASYSAKQLFQKIIYLEQNDKMLAQRMGADVLLSPPEGRFFTEEDIVLLRETVNKKRKLGGIGGVEPIAVPVEFQKLDIDYTKYALDQHFRRAIRSLASLYAIPIEVLDNESSTYNNKKTALASFYQDFLIPTAYEFIEALKHYYIRYLVENNKEYKKIDFQLINNSKLTELDRLEILSQKVELYKKLYELNVLDEVELKNILRDEIDL